MTRHAKIGHVSAKNADFILYLLNNIITNNNKIFSTIAEFNGLSSAIYTNEILCTLGSKDTGKNTTQTNLHSHGRFSQAQLLFVCIIVYVGIYMYVCI